MLNGASNLNFTSSKHKDADDADNSFSINALGGYFVANDLALGLIIGYRNFSSGDFSASSTTLGLFGRYYINSAIITGVRYINLSGEDDFSAGQLGLEVGYAAFVTDNIAIEPTLNYAIGSGDLKDINSFGINVGISVYF